MQVTLKSTSPSWGLPPSLLSTHTHTLLHGTFHYSHVSQNLSYLCKFTSLISNIAHYFTESYIPTSSVPSEQGGETLESCHPPLLSPGKVQARNPRFSRRRNKQGRAKSAVILANLGRNSGRWKVPRSPASIALPRPAISSSLPGTATIIYTITTLISSHEMINRGEKGRQAKRAFRS